MNNKNKIFIIASIVFGVIALVTIFLGVGALYHSAYRDLYKVTVDVPTQIGSVSTNVKQEVSREWYELTKQTDVTGIQMIFGGTISTAKYGELTYKFSFMAFLPYVFVILGIVSAVLKLTLNIKSRYFNILIGLLFVLGAGLFLVQIPGARLNDVSSEIVKGICDKEFAQIRKDYLIDEQLTIRSVLKPTLINYLGMASAFIASICAILPFYFGLGKEEAQA